MSARNHDEHNHCSGDLYAPFTTTKTWSHATPSREIGDLVVDYLGNLYLSVSGPDVRYPSIEKSSPSRRLLARWPLTSLHASASTVSLSMDRHGDRTWLRL
jgi:hypothetical protein